MTIDLPVHVDLLETDARLAWRIVDANGVTVPWGTVAAALNTPPRNAGVSDDVELFQVLSVPGGETMTIKYPVTAAGIFVNDADGEPIACAVRPGEGVRGGYLETLYARAAAIAAALNAYDKINLERPEVIESLAEQAHIEWSLWTRWMIDQWSPERVKRWERQIATRYIDLSETEKEADRREARAYIAAIVAAVPDVFPPKDGAP